VPKVGHSEAAQVLGLSPNTIVPPHRLQPGGDRMTPAAACLRRTRALIKFSFLGPPSFAGEREITLRGIGTQAGPSNLSAARKYSPSSPVVYFFILAGRSPWPSQKFGERADIGRNR